jgi:hypothetical protein
LENYLEFGYWDLGFCIINESIQILTLKLNAKTTEEKNR